MHHIVVYYNVLFVCLYIYTLCVCARIHLNWLNLRKMSQEGSMMRQGYMMRCRATVDTHSCTMHFYVYKHVCIYIYITIYTYVIVHNIDIDLVSCIEIYMV